MLSGSTAAGPVIFDDPQWPKAIYPALNPTLKSNPN
jgi:hypothetical protein